jgi:hypothetical protein
VALVRDAAYFVTLNEPNLAACLPGELLQIQYPATRVGMTNNTKSNGDMQQRPGSKPSSAQVTIASDTGGRRRDQ